MYGKQIFEGKTAMDLFGVDLRTPDFGESDGVDPIVEATGFIVFYGSQEVLQHLERVTTEMMGAGEATLAKVFCREDGSEIAGWPVASKIVAVEVQHTGTLCVTVTYDLCGDDESDEDLEEQDVSLYDDDDTVASFLGVLFRSLSAEGLKEIRALYQVDAFAEDGGKVTYWVNADSCPDTNERYVMRY